MSSRLGQCLRLLGLCLVFCLLETLVLDAGRAPLTDSWQGASSGPAALAPHDLVDRLNEWRHQTPEHMHMLEQLLSWTMGWAFFKLIAFSWMALRILHRPTEPDLRMPGPLAFIVQMLYLALPGVLLLSLLALCLLGLGAQDRFAYWALALVFALWGMLKISRDRSWAQLVTHQDPPLSPRHVMRGLGAWFSSPGTMVMSWILWLCQLAVAAGPLYEQATQHPGPSDPARVLPFMAAALLLWALRLWMLRQSAARTRVDL